MNSSDKEVRNAIRRLNRAADAGIKKMTKENRDLVMKLHALKETLKSIKTFKILGFETKVNELEKRLKKYEGLIDKKYWTDEALMYINISFMCNVAKSLEEAITIYENFKKM